MALLNDPYNWHGTDLYNSFFGHLSFTSGSLALREALRTAQTSHLTKVWMRSDSLELVRAVNSKSYPMELFGVLMDIEFLSSSFDFIMFSFIPRAQNTVADLLAKSALATGSASSLY